MKELKLEEILRVADELGIEYELNSEKPGMFIVDEQGVEREFKFEEIFDDLFSLE